MMICCSKLTFFSLAELKHLEVIRWTHKLHGDTSGRCRKRVVKYEGIFYEVQLDNDM